MIFSIGLFKKVVFADTMASYATPVFNAANEGITLTFFEAWGGALAYSLQLYFDFSGYSDMAIGIAHMFGISLPLNFYSPYKSKNIIEFWRRWHITLSRFLKMYLYIPLGGSRKGATRRYINLMATMLLGGLWHGAGWNFIIWGALHGSYLSINHGWHIIHEKYFLNTWVPKRITNLLSLLITFLAITFAWVFFRAESFEAALAVCRGMLGMNGFILSTQLIDYLWPFSNIIEFVDEEIGHFGSPIGFLYILLLTGVVFYFPNTTQYMDAYRLKSISDEEHGDRNETTIKFEFEWITVGLFWLLSAISISMLFISETTEFLYFNF